MCFSQTKSLSYSNNSSLVFSAEFFSHTLLKSVIIKISVLFFIFHFSDCQIGWGLKNTLTASLHRDKTPTQRVSCNWHETIWWWGSSNAGAVGRCGGTLHYHRSQIHFGLELVAPDRILSIGQIELKYVFMLNWITSDRTVLIFKLRTYAKLNCLK